MGHAAPSVRTPQYSITGVGSMDGRVHASAGGVASDEDTSVPGASASATSVRGASALVPSMRGASVVGASVVPASSVPRSAATSRDAESTGPPSTTESAGGVLASTIAEASVSLTDVLLPHPPIPNATHATNHRPAILDRVMIDVGCLKATQVATVFRWSSRWHRL